MSVIRLSITIYINNGSIKAWKMKRKTLVRRVDVEALFTASTERLTVEKEEKAITDFYTTQEVLEKYKLSNAWFRKVAKDQKFPKTMYRGKSLWSKTHVVDSSVRNLQPMTLRNGTRLLRFRKNST